MPPTPSSVSQIGTLAALPPEVLSTIVELHLPGASRAAFALTCRQFYEAYFADWDAWATRGAEADDFPWQFLTGRDPEGVAERIWGGEMIWPPGQRFPLSVKTLGHNPPPWIRGRFKLGIMTLLERDLPGVYLCVACKRLHKWPRRRGDSSELDQTPRWDVVSVPECAPPCPGLGGEGTIKSYVWHVDAFMAKNMRLHYSVARAMVNAQLYGPDHGPPLSDLEGPVEPCDSVGQLCGGEYDAQGVAMRGRWRARFVTGHLLLSAAYTLSLRDNPHQDGDSSPPLEDRLRTLPGHAICCHIATSIPAEEGSGSDWFGGRLVPTSAGVERSCRSCMTDFSVKRVIVSSSSSDDHDPAEGRVVAVDVETHHDLGDCRFNRDWHWRAATANISMPADLQGARAGNASPMTPQYRAGAVRRMWKMAEEEGDSAVSLEEPMDHWWAPEPGYPDDEHLWWPLLRYE